MTSTVFLFGTDALINIFSITISGRDSRCRSASPLPLLHSLPSLLPHSPLPLRALLSLQYRRSAEVIFSVRGRKGRCLFHSFATQIFCHSGTENTFIILSFIYFFPAFQLQSLCDPAVYSLWLTSVSLCSFQKPCCRRMSPLLVVLVLNSVKFLNKYIF